MLWKQVSVTSSGKVSPERPCLGLGLKKEHVTQAIGGGQGERYSGVQPRVGGQEV